LYKEKIDEIIQEAFESYWKVEELYNCTSWLTNVWCHL
jgi:hypothetical protein